jgi:hypothetical protein
VVSYGGDKRQHPRFVTVDLQRTSSRTPPTDSQTPSYINAYGIQVRVLLGFVYMRSKQNTKSNLNPSHDTASKTDRSPSKKSPPLLTRTQPRDEREQFI